MLCLHSLHHLLLHIWLWVHDLQDYATNICNISAYIKTSSFFHWWFNHFLDASLGKAIAGVEAEETLCEYKKETQEHAKWQSETRKVVQKSEVLRADEAAEHIEDRHKDEIALAWHTSQLRDIWENARKQFVHKLNFIPLAARWLRSDLGNESVRTRDCMTNPLTKF